MRILQAEDNAEAHDIEVVPRAYVLWVGMRQAKDKLQIRCSVNHVRFSCLRGHLVAWVFSFALHRSALAQSSAVRIAAVTNQATSGSMDLCRWLLLLGRTSWEETSSNW